MYDLKILKVPQSAIFHNTKIRHYPNGFEKCSFANKPIYKEKGWENEETNEDFEVLHKPQNKDNDIRKDSLYRARNAVFDIAALNDFEYFITWTLDQTKIDRTSPADVMKKLKIFLNNCVKRHNLSYCILPEYHSDKKGIHIHGLIKGNMEFIDSGTVSVKGNKKPITHETALGRNIPFEDCHTVYNMPQWKYGFSTALKVYGDVINLSKYITKYVTKDAVKIFGNFYYAGGHIERNVDYMLCDVDYETLEIDKTFFCKAINTEFKFLEVYT